jgi:vacuolar-type H+-ATPase subunit I/STV1
MNKQVASDPVKGLMERVLGWLPVWLGFVLIIVAGIAAFIVGIVTTSAGFIAFGVAAIASAILAWWSGAKSEPQINPFEPSFGGSVSKVDGWVWLVVFGLFLVASIIAIVAR